MGVEPQSSGSPFNPNLWNTIVPEYNPPLPPEDIEVLPTGASTHWDGSTLHIWQTWSINPQPNSETITIKDFAAWSDHFKGFEVETICIPEPASILLLGTLGAGLILKRR